MILWDNVSQHRLSGAGRGGMHMCHGQEATMRVKMREGEDGESPGFWEGFAIHVSHGASSQQENTKDTAPSGQLLQSYGKVIH